MKNGVHVRRVDSNELDVGVTTRQDGFSPFKNQTVYNLLDVK